jgi:V-type H+-transporting ATPase subunit H
VFCQHPSRDHLQTSVTSQCNVLNLYFHGQTIDKKSGICQGSSQGKPRPGILYSLKRLIKLSFVEILNRNPGPQMSYQVAFCIWLLSFEQNIAEQINKYILSFHDCIYFLMIIKYRQYDIIPTLVEVAQNAVKENVIRVIVATFRVRHRFS